jgi:hypothetical protein
MAEENIKTGTEILDEYFNQFGQDETIDKDLRKIVEDLWKQKRLGTTTYLIREIELLIERKSK